MKNYISRVKVTESLVEKKEGVSVSIEDRFIVLSMGDKSIKVHKSKLLKFDVDERFIKFKLVFVAYRDVKTAKSIVNTTKSLLTNAFNGLIEPYSEEVYCSGIAYKMSIDPDNKRRLILHLGLSHKPSVIVPDGTEYEMNSTGVRCLFKSHDKQLVSSFVSMLTKVKKQIRYGKGKGIFLANTPASFFKPVVKK